MIPVNEKKYNYLIMHLYRYYKMFKLSRYICTEVLKIKRKNTLPYLTFVVCKLKLNFLSTKVMTYQFMYYNFNFILFFLLNFFI